MLSHPSECRYNHKMVTKYEIRQEEDVIQDESIDEFIHQRTKILKSILGMLLHEVKARLGIRRNNLRRIEDDQGSLEDLVGGMKTLWNAGALKYTYRDSFLKLQSMSDELRREKRDQDISCWNDVVGVMNNHFITRWEAHQQATARARLMKGGGGLEKIIDGEFQKKKEEFMNDRLKA